jgi:N-acetyl-gamma-glutamyl-phosphate reductase
MSIVYPLVKLGIAGVDYPFSANAISGYSGADKNAIAIYENENRDKKYDAPRLYAMSQSHKHLKEMQSIPGLSQKPLFNPYVCPFLEGMLLTVPLYLDGLEGEYTSKAIHELLENYYSNQDCARVMPFDEKGTEDRFLSANHLEGKDYLVIYVSGNEERISITACLNNLGKGASGAVLDCMNIMLGLDSKTSINM